MLGICCARSGGSAARPSALPVNVERGTGLLPGPPVAGRRQQPGAETGGDPHHRDTAVPGHVQHPAVHSHRRNPGTHPRSPVTDPPTVPRPPARPTAVIEDAACFPARDHLRWIDSRQNVRRSPLISRQHPGAVGQQIIIACTAASSEHVPTAMTQSEYMDLFPYATGPAARKHRRRYVPGHRCEPSTAAQPRHRLEVSATRSTRRSRPTRHRP